MAKENIVKEKKLQICLGFIRCIQHKSYEETTIKDIALESGIAAGSIYYYFPTKEEILLAAVQINYSQHLEFLTHMLESSFPTASGEQTADRTRSLPTRFMDYLFTLFENNYEGYCGPYSIFLSTSNYVPALRELLLKQHLEMVDLICCHLKDYAKSEQLLAGICSESAGFFEWSHHQPFSGYAL